MSNIPSEERPRPAGFDSSGLTQFTEPPSAQQNNPSYLQGTGVVPGGNVAQAARNVVNGGNISDLDRLKGTEKAPSNDARHAMAAYLAIDRALDDAGRSGLGGQALVNKLFSIDSNFAKLATRIANWQQALPAQGWGGRLREVNQRLETLAMAINPHWTPDNYRMLYPILFDGKSKYTYPMVNAPSVIGVIADAMTTIGQIARDHPNQNLAANFLRANYETRFTPNSEYARLQQALRTVAQEAATVFFPGGAVRVYEDIKSGLSNTATVESLISALGAEAHSLDSRMSSPNDVVRERTGIQNAVSPYYNWNAHDGFLALSHLDPQTLSTSRRIPPELAGIIHHVPQGAPMRSIIHNGKKYWIYFSNGQWFAVDPSQRNVLEQAR
jgi:hypothetical protein